jgi:hypothetical protein
VPWARRHGRPAVLLLAVVALLAGCSSPSGHLDDAYESFPVAGNVVVTGWAYDPDTTSPIAVHVYVDGAAVTQGPAGRSRPDVEAGVPGAPGRAGFRINVPMAAGPHEVCAFAIDATGDNNAPLGCRSVDVRGMSGATCGARPTDPAAYQGMVTDRPDGWLAADMVNAVTLPDGRVLWLFGDTDWGLREDSRAYSPGFTMTTNSAILQQGACSRALGRDGNGFLDPALYGDGGMFYWPGNAFMAGGRLFVGFNRIRRDNLVRVRSELVELSLTDLRPIGMAPMPDNGRQWTQSGNVEGDWIYYHGLVVRDDNHMIYVARAPVADPVALTYWDGTTWSADASAATVVLGRAQNAVVKRLGDGRWLAVSKHIFENRVVAWTAPGPTGPFTPLPHDYTDATPPSVEDWEYMPSLHQLDDGAWMLAVNRNSVDGTRVWQGKGYYGPVFTRAPA